MAGGLGRDPRDVVHDLIGVAGLTGLAAGLVLLAPTGELGFDAFAALGGILGQLPTTVPAALLIAALAILDLAAGLAIARMARTVPFASFGEAILAAAVAALLKNAVLLGLLGAAGLFRAPVLLAVNGLLVVWLIVDIDRRGGDGATWRERWATWRNRVPAIGSLSLAALAVAVWSGPVLLQLASPVVPFIDVLPNHVAPAEHLRAFGAFDPLTVTQSPIYGPSRSLLGYVAWLGALTTMSGLPAGLAISAFILPSTLLVAVAVHRLARAIVGPELALGPWVVLAFALTTSFARLGDVRGTVVVLPFAFTGLAILADRIRAGAGAGDPWWPGSGTVAGLALGAAVLVHPVIGALAVATAGLVAMARPAGIGVAGAAAVVTASVVALPQAATMVGLALPAPALALAVVLAVAAGATVEGFARNLRRRAVLIRVVGRLPVVLAAAAGAVVVFLLLTVPDAFDAARPEAVTTAVGLLLGAVALLLAALVAGWLLGSPAARSPIVILGATVGIGAALATQLIPGDFGLLGRALRFELPKTLHYWIPIGVAVGAGASLAFARVAPRLPWPVSHLALAVFVVAAALPLRPEPIDALHLGERRWSEAMASDLRWAATGFWRGHPDSRAVVDEPRREIVAAVQAEIAAGRLGVDTQVLHVAISFQQWVATPLGVFAGVMETTVSPDAEFSIHTVGGRLHRLEDLETLLRSGAFDYVLLEPDDALPSDLGARIEAAGFRSVFANRQGTLYRASP